MRNINWVAGMAVVVFLVCTITSAELKIRQISRLVSTERGEQNILLWLDVRVAVLTFCRYWESTKNLKIGIEHEGNMQNAY